MTAGPGGRHDVERDIPEILQEVRVAQTGGQLFFAFLFSVAFAPGFDDLDGQQRLLYACDLIVVATASTLLVAPVAIHRWNFGRGLRPQFLVAAHWLACAGLVFLAVGLVLGLWLISSVVFPGAPAWIAIVSAAILVLAWLVLPMSIMRSTARR